MIELQESEAQKVASRSVSVRFCIELWAHGKNDDQFHSNLQDYLKVSRPVHKKSFKIVFETFCKHFSQKEKVEKIEVKIIT